MAYWLVKSEPDAWSWEEQVKAGTTGWSGVRNHQAANNLKAMRVGDEAFFYHSNVGRQIVGIVTVTREAYSDPGDATGRFVQVDMKTVRALSKAVTLDDIRGRDDLQTMALLRQSRLSVQPVTETEWRVILEMSR